MRTFGRLRSLLAGGILLVAVAGCAGGGGDDSLEIENEWQDQITDATSNRPEGCKSGVGDGCEAHVKEVETILGRLHEAIQKRDDKAGFKDTLDRVTTLDGKIADYYGKTCALVAEVTTDPASTQRFFTCTQLYAGIMSTANEIAGAHLRPSDT
ncbi:hypothetical protein SRB5_45960 [Streptomyces sp. RB5]|uniref:Lipoprotein n=1 Tax=Streptomyces smaragdinus TaxID=2585196 RepID=A0A7K0CLR2_9ACTN|nr:hypothetical protein [Streptomyces smaragdinus]MQY14429.1 hypothetical protein [Streptomyces smaragdinus]